MKTKLLISGIGSLVLGVIGIIVFAFNNDYLGSSFMVRESHDAYEKYLGGLTSGAMNTIATISITAGILFLIMGVILLIKAVKSKH